MSADRINAKMGQGQFGWMHLLKPLMRNSFIVLGMLQLLMQQIMFITECLWNTSGTFGQVLECWDRERKEMVAVKITRSTKTYRDAAMIEIGMLEQLGKYDKSRSR
jgi:hypothetical protein